MPIEIQSDHLAAWRARVASAQAEINPQLAQRLREHIAQGWSALSPSTAGSAPAIDTGALAESISEQANPNGIQVGTPLSYGAALEFGTVTLAARPWLRPAMERLRAEIPQIIRESLV